MCPVVVDYVVDNAVVVIIVLLYIQQQYFILRLKTRRSSKDIVTFCLKHEREI